MPICRRKSIDKSPPAKMPIARKARTSAGEPVLENSPEGPPGSEVEVEVEVGAELATAMELSGANPEGRMIVADSTAMLNAR